MKSPVMNTAHSTWLSTVQLSHFEFDGRSKALLATVGCVWHTMGHLCHWSQLVRPGLCLCTYIPRLGKFAGALCPSIFIGLSMHSKREAKKAAMNYKTGMAQWRSETGHVCIYVRAYQSSSSMLRIMLSLPPKKRTEKPGRLLQDNNAFTSYGTIFTLSGVKYLDQKSVQFQFHPNRIHSANWKWNTRCQLLSVFRQECLQCHLMGMTWRIGFAVLGNRMLQKL